MHELVLNCSQDQAEAWSEALLAAGALSVTLEDADEGSGREVPQYGEPGFEPATQAWSHNRLVVLLQAPDEADRLIESLRVATGQAPAPDGWFRREVPALDWVRATQSQFGPIQVNDRIRIVPSWHREGGDERPEGAPQPVQTPVQSACVTLQLDPGLAFGTGSHPTTQLCLSWLAAHEPAGRTVLDYGCGSGVLGIAAGLLGASAVHAVDVDAQAVRATRENAAINRVSVQAGLPDALPAQSFDVVLANILSGPLKVLAPLLCARVAPGGWLVLSGVLARQADEVCAAYAPWLGLVQSGEQDGWVCLSGRRD